MKRRDRRKQHRKKYRKQKWLVALLLLITATAVCVSIWALFFRDTDPMLAPDYAPQDEEQNQRAIEDDSDDKLDAAEGGGAVSLSYSPDVTIDLSDGTAALRFANPGRSTQDMVVQVVIQDQILVQSGRLTPGHEVTDLDLMDGAEKQLSEGVYEGKFTVLFYHPDSGEKAVVNTDIPITVTVRE